PPRVADHATVWGPVIPSRRQCQQYANVRPVRLPPGIEPAVKNFAPGQIEFVVVRENNEGEYSNIGGRLYSGTEDEFAVQQSVFTLRGCDRIIRYAFEMGNARRRHVTSSAKSYGIN